MSNHITTYDHLNGFYRPGLSFPDQLVNTTVGRDTLLEEVIEKLNDNKAESERTSFMIMGPPGVGKTHFIRVLGRTIQNRDSLKDRFILIQFPEENHRILTFADLLTGIVEILENMTAEKQWSELYRNLVELEDDTVLIETAIPEFESYCKTNEKTMLILLENIDVFFRGQLRDNKNVKQFRKFITKSSFANFIGTSQFNLIKSEELRKSPFTLFDIHILDVLDEKETLQLIKKKLEWEKQNELLDSFEELTPRIRALYEMSGGNPRLSLILYELLVKESKWDIKRQLEKLLDQTTPFFRDRMRSLAPQERALLEIISLMKLDYKTTAKIAKASRQSHQQTANHLNKLLKAGYLVVVDHPTDKRSRIYRIKEGFFGLWLAIGHSRKQNIILPRLVEFFEQWYAEKTVREKKRQQIWNSLRSLEVNPDLIEIDNQELLLQYLSDIGDDKEKARSKLELVFYFLSLAKIREAKRLILEIYELDYAKPYYFEWLLQQCKSWISGNIEPVILQEMEDIQKCWNLQNLNLPEALGEQALNLAINFFNNGFYDLVQSFVEDMLSTGTDPRIRILLLERVAVSQEKLKNWDSAISSWKEVLENAEKHRDYKSQGTILNNISQIYQDQGNYDLALENLTKSLQILKKIKDYDGQGTTLNNISTIHFDQGYFEKALERLEEALGISKISGNLFIEGITLSNLSMIYQARGDFEPALDCLYRALDYMRKIGDSSSECITLNNISQVQLELGLIDDAFRSLQHALYIAQDENNKQATCLTLYNRGKLHKASGKNEEAMINWTYAYKIAREENVVEVLEKLDKVAESKIDNSKEFWQNRLKDLIIQEQDVETPGIN